MAGGLQHGGEALPAHRIAGAQQDAEAVAHVLVGRAPTVTVTRCTSPARSSFSVAGWPMRSGRQRRRQTAGAAGAAAVDLQDDVAGQHAGLLGRRAGGEADHHQAGVTSRRVAQAAPAPAPAAARRRASRGRCGRR